MALYKRVLERAYTQLIDDLDPTSLLDCLLEKGVFSYRVARDIQEIATTSCKNREIVNRIITLNEVGYHCFKECLRKSYQGHLADLLTDLETTVRRESKSQPIGRVPQQGNFHLAMEGQHGWKHNLEGSATELDLVEVTSCIGNGLQSIGPHLGLSRVEIEHIEADNSKSQNQIREMLYRWRQNKQRKGEKASLSLLFGILCTVEGAVIDWEKLKEKFGLPYNYENASTSLQASTTGIGSGMSKLSLHENYTPNQSVYEVPIVGFNSMPSAGINSMPSGSINSMPSGHMNSIKNIDHPDAKKNVSLTSSGHVEKSFKKIFPVGCFRDGRLFTLDSHHIEVVKRCVESTKKGSYGKVYFSRKPVAWTETGLNIPIVLKKIKCDQSKSSSVCNEKLASRIMHFAIVPLLAAHEDPKTKTFYFLYPYFTNGDLAAAIETHATRKVGSTTPWNQMSVLRVLYQIASAIIYLHTPVLDFRKAVIHNDISSKHIVLDSQWNARLTDFRSAKEINEAVESKRCDFTNFGCVILELLTFQPQEFDQKAIDRLIEQDPSWKIAAKSIIGRTLSSLEKYCIDLLIKKDLWNEGTAHSTLQKLAEQLIKDEQRSEMSDVVCKIKEMLRELGGSMFCDDVQQTKCQICLINQRNQPGDCCVQHNKCHSVGICVACIRNSHINPIPCPLCGQNIESVIGNKWAALLIAGNDLKNVTAAKTFIDDVQMVKTVMISKCPLVMGISEKHVETVALKEQNFEKCVDLTSELDCAFQKLKVLKLETLWIYYSGHHEDDKGFLLGDKHLLKTELEQKLMDLPKTYTKIIVILDCCKPPALQISSKKLIQINACKSHDSAIMIESSIFTKYFIQCLMGKSPNKKCSAGLCTICAELSSEGGFITVGMVLRYVNNHYKLKYSEDIEPVQYAKNIAPDDTKIAYFTNTEIVYEFKHCFLDKEVIQPIPLCDLYNTTKEELFIKLFEFYNGNMGLNLDPQKYYKIICITTETEQKSQLPEELDTKDKLYWAWVGKRHLIVSLRDVKSISKGPVGLYTEDTNILMSELKKEIIYEYLSWDKWKTMEPNACYLHISSIYKNLPNVEEKYSGLKIDIPNEKLYCLELVNRQATTAK